MSQKPISQRQTKRNTDRPRVKNTQRNERRSAQSAKSRKGSKASSSHYIYGLHAVRAALLNPRREKISLLCSKNALERLSANNTDLLAGIDQQILSPKELDRIVGSEAVHQGIVLKVMPLPRLNLDALDNYRLIVILDQITDPHNVGAILRTACAFGASAVITTARHAPKETGVMAKSASGALDILPFIEVNNLGEAIKAIKKQAVWCVGLDSEAEASLNKADIDHNVALILGAEGKGLRQKTRQLCDQMFRLDMPGEIKSLNVSNAAAIAMYALSN